MTFALLVELHKQSKGDAFFAGLLQTSTLALGVGEELAKPSADTIAKEKTKAQEGYCETYLWNCTDLCESSPQSHEPISI